MPVVMEPARPDVNSWLLDFVQNYKFAIKDFYEKRYGGIRLTLKITPILAETISLWSEKIESVIEQVKAILLGGGSGEKKKQLNSPLIRI
jgi:hypothetical protein